MELYNIFTFIALIVNFLGSLSSKFFPQLNLMEKEYNLISNHVNSRVKNLNKLFVDNCFDINTPHNNNPSVSLKSNSIANSLNSLSGQLPSCHLYLALCLREGIEGWKGWGSSIRRLRFVRFICFGLGIFAIIVYLCQLLLSNYQQTGAILIFETITYIIGVALILSFLFLAISSWECRYLHEKRNNFLQEIHEEYESVIIEKKKD